jgi:hypothetical protein
MMGLSKWLRKSRTSEEPLFPTARGEIFAALAEKVSLGTAKSWAYSARNNGALYLLIISEDDIGETYPQKVYSEQELNRRVDTIDRTCTLLQVVDLSGDIDAQLAEACYVN